MVISKNEKYCVFKKNSAENCLQTNVLLLSSIHYVHILSEKGGRVKALTRLLEVGRFLWRVHICVHKICFTPKKELPLLLN